MKAALRIVLSAEQQFFYYMKKNYFYLALVFPIALGVWWYLPRIDQVQLACIVNRLVHPSYQSEFDAAVARYERAFDKYQTTVGSTEFIDSPCGMPGLSDRYAPQCLYVKREGAAEMKEIWSDLTAKAKRLCLRRKFCSMSCAM